MKSRRTFLHSFAAIVSSATLGRIVGRSIVESSHNLHEEIVFDSERLSDRANRILQLSKEEAVKFKATQVGTEHLLIALFSESELTSGNWLGGLRAQAQDFRDTVECLGSTLTTSEAPNSASLTMSESMSSTLKTSAEIAAKQSSTKVQPAHLLLGMLESKSCSARKILMEMWFDERQLRRFAQRQLVLKVCSTVFTRL